MKSSLTAAVIAISGLQYLAGIKVICYSGSATINLACHGSANGFTMISRPCNRRFASAIPAPNVSRAIIGQIYFC
jgi:hypothetical protein